MKFWEIILSSFVLTGVVTAGAQSPASAQDVALFTGEFRGVDRQHDGEGGFQVLKTRDGYQLQLADDFRVTRGPDLYVYLSTSETVEDDGSLELGKIKAFRGHQEYDIAGETDLADYSYVVIWCKRFGVLFSWGKLQSS